MSYRKVSGAVAAVVTALALSASAYGDGTSPNGPPGPEGNPNQPAAQPQANGPQGPAGNEAQGNNSRPAAKSHGKSGQSHGKSGQSHGKSQAQSHGKSNSSHGKSQSKPVKSHANPNPGTPRKGGREDRPADKITICHATKSVKNPYVEITISLNGLHGHGPAEDPHHHAGSWKDIIPAPAEGCPTTVQEQTPPAGTEQPQQPTTTNTEKPAVTTTPEVAVTAPASTTAPATEQQAVLGEHVSGTTPAGTESAPGATKVLGVQASGSAPKAALAARNADERSGSLPFTGFELVIVLLAAAAALLGGFALRRATTSGR
jgi:cobalamin biosynthesis Mg chelatase CobN